MKKLLLAICLLINTPIVFADAQQEAERAAYGVSMASLLERYKIYYDPQEDITLDIVGYDGPDLVHSKNNIDVYKVSLLFGDPDIPRIYKVCDITFTNKNGYITYSKLNPRKCY